MWALCRRSLFADDQQQLMYFLLAATLFTASLVSTVVAWRVAKLETTPKLYSFTFLLVAFGSQTIMGARPPLCAPLFALRTSMLLLLLQGMSRPTKRATCGVACCGIPSEAGSRHAGTMGWSAAASACCRAAAVRAE